MVGADLIDVGAPVEEGERRLYMTLASSVQECGHAARLADQHLTVRGAHHRRSPGIVGPGPRQRLCVDVSRIVTRQQKVALSRDGRLNLGRAGLPAASRCFGLPKLGDRLAKAIVGLPIDDHAPKHVDALGPDVGIGAVFEQRHDGFRTIVRGREHQRGLARRRLTSVHLRAAP